MQRFFRWLLKFLRNVLIFFILISIVTFVIAKLVNTKYSTAYENAGIISLVLGLVSIIGNMNMSADPKIYQAESLSSRSMQDSAEENMKSRDKSFKFLGYMVVVAALLILASIILGRLNL